MLDLSSAEAIQDPYPSYRWLRDEAPVHFWEIADHERRGAWVVSRYEDVRALLADDRLIRRSERVGFERDLNPPILLFLDPPEHTRLRKPVTSTFTRARVAALRTAIRTEVETLTGPLVAGERVEVVDELARPLPLHTIVRLLGFDLADATYLHGLATAILDGVDSATRSEDSRGTRGEEASEELFAYMADQVRSRRSEPRDDLMSALLVAEVQGVALTPEEVASHGAQLLVNGHETTVNLIGTMLFRLLSRREAWERVVSDPDLAPLAVEEALRYDAPTQRATSYTMQPVTLHGTTIPAGQHVMMFLGAANHDDRVFHRPEVFDPARRPNPHLTFGHGRHHCPGAALSRLQAEEVLRHLVHAAPDLELVGDPPRWRRNSQDRGLESVTVARSR